MTNLRKLIPPCICSQTEPEKLVLLCYLGKGKLQSATFRCIILVVFKVAMPLTVPGQILNRISIVPNIQKWRGEAQKLHHMLWHYLRIYELMIPIPKMSDWERGENIHLNTVIMYRAFRGNYLHMS